MADTPFRKIPYGLPALSKSGGDVSAAMSDLAKNTALAHNINVSLLQRVAGAFVITATDPPSMEVISWPGALLSQGSLVEKPIQPSPTIVAPVSNPRIDRIDLDGTTGNLIYKQGTEANNPAAPPLSTGAYPLATILLVPGQVSIGQNQITDKRVFGGAIGSSQAPGGGSPPPPPPPGIVPAFYVSPTGNDSNNGTGLTTPFATLEAAQTAMRNSSTIKTTYLMAGNHSRTTPFILTAQDSGTTWAYYPPDGVNQAIFDGGGTVDGMWVIQGATGYKIDGIKIKNVGTLAIAGITGGDNSVIQNCDIGFNSQASGSQWGFDGFVPLVSPNGKGITIQNNYIHDAVSQCLAIYAYNAGDSIDGLLIQNNFVERSCRTTSDGGCIYINMSGSGNTGGTVKILNNYVRDMGATGVGGVVGIYLDDNTSNTTVSGNVIAYVESGWSGNTSREDASAVQDYGGNNGLQPQNNVIKNNIVDLGPTAKEWTWHSQPGNGQSNLVFENNIIISNYAGGIATPDGQAYATQSSGTTVQNNMYHNYGTGTVTTTGTPNDSSPISADPKLSGWTYVLDPTSPALSAAPTGISFVDITRTWGPVGFVVPQTGTPPSCPH